MRLARVRLTVAASLLLIARAAAAQTGAQTPITYRVSFEEAAHHVMRVELTAAGLGATPLQVRMSRSSPGRYAVHEFAKNVFSFEAFNGAGKALTAITRPNVDEWDVAGHDGTVRVVYRIFGDTADGTYFGVDTTHAHLNMPAAFMWVVGRDMQPIRITFAPPNGSNWKAGTQLFTTTDPWTFTAPNLQYFMDSPTELANLVISTFTVPNTDGTPANFRIAMHGDGTQADVDALATLVQRLVREEMAVFGEFPKYEPGNYTFLLDYAPWGGGDGMEHRNSTSISNPGLSVRSAQAREEWLDTIAHEFFHNWNVERIRPAGLEPFDFTRENITCCLWLAEGFTQYYGPLLLERAGLDRLANAPPGTDNVIQVINGSGRTVRSVVQMSEYAPFSDAATSIDLPDRNRSFISYYTYGAAVAFGLDLSLRELSAGRLTLDDYMRLLWLRHGKPGGPAPGLVGKPYTLKDLRDLLAELTNNRKFADDFFDKYVEGRDVVDYTHLLGLAGYVMKPAAPGRAFISTSAVQESSGGLVVGGGRGGRGTPVAFNTPLYDAGVDEGDTITTIDGARATMAAWQAITQQKPGDKVVLGVRRRDGTTVTATATLKADPSISVQPIESAGGTLTPAQKTFRDAWLSTKVR